MIRSCRLLLLLGCCTGLLASGCGTRTTAQTSAEANSSDAPVVVCLGYADVENGCAELRAERPGRVTQVWVQEGDEVQENQQLLALDDAEARQEVLLARAGVKAAQAREAQAQQEAKQHPSKLQQLKSTLQATSSRLAGARITLRRQQDLYSRNLISKGEVDLAQEQVRELEASVEAAQARLTELSVIDPRVGVQLALAELEAAQARLAQSEHALRARVLRAPSAGTVVTLTARPGEVIGQPGTPAPILFCPQRPFIVRAEVEQELVTRVAPKMPAQVRDEMSGTGPWPGQLDRIGRLYTRRQHRTDPTQFVDVPTVECLIRLDPGHPPLRIGQKLRVSIYAPSTGS